MTNKAKYLVWVWNDEDGIPQFVGWGRLSHNYVHPAKRVWAQRNRYDSELNRWLRSLSHEPARCDKAISEALPRKEASGMATIYRNRAVKDGFQLLRSRPDGSWEGGGSNRQVISPELIIYPSIRKAATDVGVNPSSVTRWCKDTDKTGWAYLS